MSANRNIPVFVIPSSLQFCLHAKESHKQFLTIHNPYDFPVSFSISCTDPTKYHVKVPEGSLGPNSLVDIGIRHIMPDLENCGIIDKFKINMVDKKTRQMLGFKVVEAILLDNVKKGVSDTHDEYNESHHHTNEIDNQRRYMLTPSTFYIILTLGFVSLIILCLPTSRESIDVPNSIFPSYLEMKIQTKLFCSFLLGMITQILFKIV
ncbi:hypothetical protein WA026_013803 [Henosepilachna vigintioctopunctata]|uniref:MSP domain-containing protein n=1 Tax=Henosepilachna vigintioctopunctata TaxID=420089 RepID=A0AAW1UTW5_9CUCU